MHCKRLLYTSTCAHLPSKAVASASFNSVAAALLYDSEPISAYRFGSTQLQVEGLSTLSGPTHHLMAQRSLAAELQLLQGHVAVMVACVPGNTPFHGIPSILAQLNSCNKEFNRKKKNPLKFSSKLYLINWGPFGAAIVNHIWRLPNMTVRDVSTYDKEAGLTCCHWAWSFL